ncbi:triose-phosphate isomerase [Gluconacetobacter azotocaptans]|uniref:triose-phosphate isomerase n=1 Tax=Gluconacetobacter azotocaptans TaxID=142834 RepID=UPI00195B12E3|nr:triose-phosphate isomerase [Gluconacetobacter azotocaptans]MBM9403458.1 triose-phosphate isomerase [Gluconacetobacter azotocaptans]
MSDPATPAPGWPFWVGTSWKMNGLPDDARSYAERIAAVDDWHGVLPFVMPPFTVLADVARLLRDSPVQVGGQNMHWDECGSWTGEISAPMLRQCGATMVELGHSERRRHFGETDQTVNLKVHAALRHGLTPLVCIGETQAERDGGVADLILARQVRLALHGLTAAHVGRVMFAYEPVWAIGEAGRPAPPELVAQAAAGIRQELDRAAGAPGVSPPLLYGGSVNLENAAPYAALAGIDGLFVGRAAWTAEGYAALARAAARPPRRGP